MQYCICLILHSLKHRLEQNDGQTAKMNYVSYSLSDFKANLAWVVFLKKTDYFFAYTRVGQYVDWRVLICQTKKQVT